MGKLLWWERLNRNTLRSSGPASSEHVELLNSTGNEHLILTGITSVVWVQSALRSPLIFMLNRSKRAVRKGCLLLPSSAQHWSPREGMSVFHYSSAHFIGLLWGFQSCSAGEEITKSFAWHSQCTSWQPGPLELQSILSHQGPFCLSKSLPSFVEGFPLVCSSMYTPLTDIGGLDSFREEISKREKLLPTAKLE